jgi:hypothetical protein
MCEVVVRFNPISMVDDSTIQKLSQASLGLTTKVRACKVMGQKESPEVKESVKE